MQQRQTIIFDSTVNLIIFAFNPIQVFITKATQLIDEIQYNTYDRGVIHVRPFTWGSISQYYSYFFNTFIWV